MRYIRVHCSGSREMEIGWKSERIDRRYEFEEGRYCGAVYGNDNRSPHAHFTIELIME